MLVKQRAQFVVQLLGGQLGLGVNCGGDVSLSGVPVDGFNVPQLPKDELSLRVGDVKTTHHQQMVRGECMGHQAGSNKLLTFPVQHPVYDVPTAVGWISNTLNNVECSDDL